MITNAKVEGTAILPITQLMVTPEWNVQIADCYHTCYEYHTNGADVEVCPYGYPY